MKQILDNPRVAENNARNLPLEGQSTLDRLQLPPKIKVTIEIEEAKEAAITEFAIKFLRDRGYGVSEPNAKWETPTQFNHRLGLSHHGFYRALKRDNRPQVVLRTGPTGRVIELLSNAEFDQFCLRNK